MVYVMEVCWQLASRIRTELVWHIPLLCVQWKTPDDGQKNCPKHVEFCSKNKFEKLVHPVGFIIRTFLNLMPKLGSLALFFLFLIYLYWLVLKYIQERRQSPYFKVCFIWYRIRKIMCKKVFVYHQTENRGSLKLFFRYICVYYQLTFTNTV